jgi:hypothetical protein
MRNLLIRENFHINNNQNVNPHESESDGEDGDE